MSGKRNSFVCADAVVAPTRAIRRGRKTRIDTILLSKGSLLNSETANLVDFKNAQDAQAFLRPAGGSGFKMIVKLPLDRAFFRSVDLRQLVLAVEEAFHVIH